MCLKTNTTTIYYIYALKMFIAFLNKQSKQKINETMTATTTRTCHRSSHLCCIQGEGLPSPGIVGFLQWHQCFLFCVGVK